MLVTSQRVIAVLSDADRRVAVRARFYVVMNADGTTSVIL